MFILYSLLCWPSIKKIRQNWLVHMVSRDKLCTPPSSRVQVVPLIWLYPANTHYHSNPLVWIFAQVLFMKWTDAIIRSKWWQSYDFRSANKLFLGQKVVHTHVFLGQFCLFDGPQILKKLQKSFFCEKSTWLALWFLSIFKNCIWFAFKWDKKMNIWYYVT